jgi:hypothetical protein
MTAMNFTTARRMVGAEFLKLSKKRSLIAWAAVLAIGTVALFFGYNVVQHASDPANHIAAGGTHGFNRATTMLAMWFGSLAAILIGAEAGAADIASGVFRDLVVTGRSRLALFAVRAPAAIALTWMVTAVGFAVAVAATFAFAGSLATPSASLIIESGLWIAAANAIVATVAVGLASLTGSRPVALVALIGWQTLASNLLLNTKSLGSARDVVLNGALSQLKPGAAVGDSRSMSLGIALLVVTGWVVIWGALGAWRTQVRDA